MQKRHSFELLLVLVVFCIYAAGSLFLCAIGANTYKDISASMQKNYDLRTGVMYLAEKTRQNDVAGGIAVKKMYGADALVLTEQVTGRGFETWIFVYDGMLCEIVIASGSSNNISLSMLQRIMPMKTMTLTLDKTNLLSVQLVTPEGTTSSITLNVSSSGDSFYFDPSLLSNTTPTVSIMGGA